MAQIKNEIAITVGTGIPSLCYDLYKVKASERKTELRTIVFRLADRVSQLTEQLKGSYNNVVKMLKVLKLMNNIKATKHRKF